MPATIHRPSSFAEALLTTSNSTASNSIDAPRRVRPSIVDPATARRFTLDQELEPFGSWVGEPIWVPPKDTNGTLVETMLQKTGPFTAREKRWEAVIQQHRNDFTQVREFDLFEASIRLPKGKFFVTVTEQKDFDKITDAIPKCVQTRLDEFLSGPGPKRGAKVYYLKPLCVEVGDELVLTTREDLTAAVAKIQNEVFAEYRRKALYRRPLAALAGAANMGLAIPREAMNYVIQRRKKALDAYNARLEFRRRMLAMEAATTHRKCRTDDCTFNDMLNLTTPLDQRAVVNQYCIEHELSQAKRAQMLRVAAGTMPWFVALSLTIYSATSLAIMFCTPPVVVCDPAFVVEMPGSEGVVLKIGHFDEVGGVTHVEI